MSSEFNWANRIEPNRESALMLAKREVSVLDRARSAVYFFSLTGIILLYIIAIYIVLGEFGYGYRHCF